MLPYSLESLWMSCNPWQPHQSLRQAFQRGPQVTIVWKIKSDFKGLEELFKTMGKSKSDFHTWEVAQSVLNEYIKKDTPLINREVHTPLAGGAADNICACKGAVLPDRREFSAQLPQPSKSIE